MNKPTASELWPGLAPDWMLSAPEWLEDFFYNLYKCFIYDNRYQLIVEGFRNTLSITFFALLIGVVLGIIVAVIRVTWDKNRSTLIGAPKVGLGIVNALCKIYLTVIRGTPVVVQLLIMFFVLFGSNNNKFLACVLCFGINSGAYVAEIVRSGIMSVDIGQTEAGRSLGLGYTATMWHIVIPQAFKTVLPTLANEFIVLLKETAVAGYIGTADITYAAFIIAGNSYVYFYPLIGAALVYLVLVTIFTWLVGKLERRLRDNER